MKKGGGKWRNFRRMPLISEKIDVRWDIYRRIWLIKWGISFLDFFFVAGGCSSPQFQPQLKLHEVISQQPDSWVTITQLPKNNNKFKADNTASN